MWFRLFWMWCCWDQSSPRAGEMERAFKQQENNNPDSRQRHILLLKRTHSTFKPSGIKERKSRVWERKSWFLVTWGDFSFQRRSRYQSQSQSLLYCMVWPRTHINTLRMLCKPVTYTAGEGNGGQWSKCFPWFNLQQISSFSSLKKHFSTAKREIPPIFKMSSVCWCADVDKATLYNYRHLTNRWSFNNSFRKHGNERNI